MTTRKGLRRLLNVFVGNLRVDVSQEDRGTSQPTSAKKLVLDSVNYFMSKLVPGLMGFLSVLIFVRLMGYQQYGYYAVSFGVIMASASGMAAWLSQGILRFHSQATDRETRRLFSAATTWGKILSVLLGTLALGIILRLSGLERGSAGLIVSAVLFTVLLWYTVTLAQFQARLQSHRVLQMEIIRSVACLGIPGILMTVKSFRDYRVLLTGLAAGYVVSLVAGNFAVIPSSEFGWRARPPFRREVGNLLRSMWRYGWPVAVWMLSQQALAVSDRLFVQHYAGYSDAGIYASMYDVVVRSFSLIFMPVTLAVHPLVMDRWNAGDFKDAFGIIRRGFKYQLLTFLPVGAGLLAAGPWIARLVLGKSITAATNIVLPLAISGFLWQSSLLAHKPLELLCKTERMLVGMLLALAINVSGNWLLIPLYGYKAAAYVAIASSATYLISVFFLTPKAKVAALLDARDASGAEHQPSVPNECVVELT